VSCCSNSSLILSRQHELALEDDDGVDRGRLMTTLDDMNQRYGRGTVLMASAGLAGKSASLEHEAGTSNTPGYTTCLADIAVARA
jgi:DNA polymerase V